MTRQTKSGHAYDVKVVGRDSTGEKIVVDKDRFERVGDIRWWAECAFGEVEEVYPWFWRNLSKNVAIYYEMVY